MSLTPQRIVIAACCGLIATGALYATQNHPVPDVMDSASLSLPAMAAPLTSTAAGSSGAPRQVRRVVVTHDRPGQIIFSWDGPDLRVEIRDATPSMTHLGASAS